ncbi:MAG: CoA-transferase [Myxococcota bacterium]|nr:CoA-transferase [Myxococcota bacterium]
MGETPASRAEVCAAAVADAFRGDGERLASCFGAIPAIGAKLAKLTFEPDLMMTDGIAYLRDDVAPVSGEPQGEAVVESWLPFRSVFDLLWNGRRHVVMTASQIDRYGNHNFACIGPHEKPKAQLLGMRGAPGNTISHTTSYWVPNHSAKVFVEAVDVVSGVGYDRARELGAASSRFHEIRRVISNLGVFDFGTDDRRMRLASAHPGTSVDEIVEQTGFELVIPSDVPETRTPTGEELELIRERLDPGAARDREVPH